MVFILTVPAVFDALIVRIFELVSLRPLARRQGLAHPAPSPSGKCSLRSIVPPGAALSHSGEPISAPRLAADSVMYEE